MPYFNQLYESAKLEINPLKPYNIEETEDRTADTTGESTAESTGSVNGQTSSTGKTKQTTEKFLNFRISHKHKLHLIK